jgi:hypothetical protein
MGSSIHITFRKKRYRIVQSINSDLVPIIKELVAYLLHGVYLKSERYYRLQTLKILSHEAYENIKLIDPSLDMTKLEIREAEDWELHNHYYELEKEDLQSQYFIKERALDKKLKEMDKAVAFYQKVKTIPIYAVRPVIYPDVPISNKVSILDRESIPSVSGVYFVWLHDICEYVGKSKNLRNRVCPTHEKISLSDKLTFLTFAESDLNFAESYYIGVMRPRRNFMTLDGKTNEKMDSTLLL